MAKKKLENVDGLGPKDIKSIRSALRKVWSWSYPKKLAAKRAIGKDGFARCEKCKKKVPQVFQDHITPCGDVDGGYIKRMWCASKFLQNLCKACHNEKTRLERREAKLKEMEF